MFAPAWEWTTRPETRFLTASYVDKLATDFSVWSRDLIRSAWFQARWGHLFEMKSDADLKTRYFNDQGGSRIATSVGGAATGSGGDIILVDDPHNTEEVENDLARTKVLDWHDGTLATRFNDPETGVEILIMQRVHERDLTGHVLDLDPGEWTLLCLPEEYERKHPHRYPKKVKLPSGRVLNGDPRTDEGELLHPDRIGPARTQSGSAGSGVPVGGQLQQRPTAHEGSILKRDVLAVVRPGPPGGRPASTCSRTSRLSCPRGTRASRTRPPATTWPVGRGACSAATASSSASRWSG